MKKDVFLDERLREAMKKIIEYEEREEERIAKDKVLSELGVKPYWDWQDVGVDFNDIKKLRIAGVVMVIGGKKKRYLLVNREETKRRIEEIERLEREAINAAISQPIQVPEDMFDVIIGYDDMKKFLKKVVTLDEPFHVLFVGPPGTAKTLFLMEFERIPRSKLITAGTSTKVGIRDLLIEERPRFLLIDELEKIGDPNDLSVLLTLMESQRVIVTKHGSITEERFPCSVIAACNSTKKLPQELLDRFQVFRLRKYTREEYIEIVKTFLTKRRGVSEDVAKYIAEKVSEYTLSVREAVRVSKVAKNIEEVDKVIRLFRTYSNTQEVSE